ncbi:iron uptake porin [Brasilonema sp. UFV-L1]|uniref:iron uptake porin n=1 Tax=Brasilonema sp. UFV-L1 TaxID=2234130 RepID=UPI00145E15BD|nr:iron uptake porin [Brasilonema sp. UFV-L1]NMG09005.1 S-layer protein [Brasilonema sp. UFV-L1]
MIGRKYLLLSSASAIFLGLSATVAKAVEKPALEEEALQSTYTTVAQLSEKQSVTSEKKTEANSLDGLKKNTTLQSDLNINAEQSIVQVTNVSQLEDVQPTDWAFDALRNLVERYGCIAGYPDGTFRGNRAMTRYEFAAGLNACLEQINTLINQSTSEAVRQEDLQTLQRLSEDFQAELASVRGRIDTLEAKTAELQANQFSTTTVLGGEVIFGIASAFGGNPPGGCSVPDASLYGARAVDCRNPREPQTNTTLAHLTRLGLETSFTGKDRLRTYLVTGNSDNGGFTNAGSLNTYMARLSYQADLDNQVKLDLLEYRFPAFGDRVVFSVIPYGFSLSNVLSANSPYFDIGRGSISRFGQLNPIFQIGSVLDAGVGFDWLLSDKVRLQVAYGTGNSSNPDGGIIGSDRSVLGVQLVATPFNNVITGLSYVNAYTSDGVLGTYTGSVNAETTGLWSGGRLPNQTSQFNNNQPDADPGLGVELGNFPAQTHAVGATLQWRLAKNLTFGAWGGWTFTNFLKEIPEFAGDDRFTPDVREAGKKPFGNTVTYLFSLGLSDPFGREGDLLAFLFGMPPKLVDAGPTTPGQSVPFFEQVVRDEDPVPVTDNDSRVSLRDNPSRPGGSIDQFGRKDRSTSLHFELFYRFRVNDNLWITPGLFVVTNPGHIAENDAIFVATLRTTFRF